MRTARQSEKRRRTPVYGLWVRHVYVRVGDYEYLKTKTDRTVSPPRIDFRHRFLNDGMNKTKRKPSHAVGNRRPLYSYFMLSERTERNG